MTYSASDPAVSSGMSSQIASALQQIETTIAWLRSQVQQDVITDWQSDQGIHPINEKGYIVWAKGRQEIWLKQTIALPEQLTPEGYPLAGMTARLALTWWAEQAEIFVDGEKVQEGDLFDHSARIVLQPSVPPGEAVQVVLRLVSPGHDIGALMRSRLVFEAADGGIDPGFVADEVAVVKTYLQAFEPEGLLELATRLDHLPWRAVGSMDCRSEPGGNLMPEASATPWPTPLCHWTNLCHWLRQQLTPWQEAIAAHRIYLLGHAHLDLAWLWTVEETWQAAERTFTSVLNLQRQFPELIFCHTTPVLYEWMAKNRPALFAQMQQQIKLGRWEALGGLWVEPELNVIGGEAIARHILYGQRYYQETFGAISRIAWLPDTFGFCWQLPQFLQQGGMDYFVTQKLRWNDTNPYPHEVFQWQAPDGSQVVAYMSAPIGEGIDPIKLSDYAWQWRQRTGSSEALWLPGVGDHGGGPTRDMLEVHRRWKTSDYFPKLEFTSAIAYLDRLSQDNLPVHASEIYLEFHRGCYTTHADQKAANRDCENALYQAELWSSIAAILGLASYPKNDLETAWKDLLFNQFHDILPGTSIQAVFPDANQRWQAVLSSCDRISSDALGEINQQINIPEFAKYNNGLVITVFNALNWSYSAIVDCPIDLLQQFADSVQEQALVTTWQVQDEQGRQLSIQQGDRLQFLAEDLPSVGYRCFYLVPVADPLASCPLQAEEILEDVSSASWILENTFVKVQIDASTGEIAACYDKENNCEIFRGNANQLQIFKDEGQYWDAWNIDPNYEKNRLSSPTLHHIEWLERNPLQSRLQVTLAIELADFTQIITQIYCLEAHSPLLKITTLVDWQARHLLVKAAFPVNFTADEVTYETACGAIDRPTQPITAAEKAQWEVPGLRWASLSDGTVGLSLLCDRKHGYNHRPDQLRLTLLRGSEWPDPEADRGQHQFTYGIYPHGGNWRTAQTPQRALELTVPLQTVIADPAEMEGELPPQASLLAIRAENLVLLSLKQSEQDSQHYILRCHECYGEPANFAIETSLPIELTQRVDILENAIEASVDSVKPWQIASWQFQQRKIR
ncbi:MAG: alpha-mannosidase [Synechococcales bacterium]|nr:alpha-mannosidase [Synechococcales bacterium]